MKLFYEIHGRKRKGEPRELLAVFPESRWQFALKHAARLCRHRKARNIIIREIEVTDIMPVVAG